MRVVVHRYGWNEKRTIPAGGISAEIHKAGQLGGQSATSAKQIAAHVIKLGGKVYIEPFLGRGSVYRAVASRKTYDREILNDLDCKRVAAARKLICPTKKGASCERLTAAKPTCGKDWTKFLKYDSPQAVWYLDPPFEGVASSDKLYRHNQVPLEAVLSRIRKLRGAVALSYKNTPAFRKQICRRPFRCRLIKKSLFKNRWTELLAVKRAS